VCCDDALNNGIIATSKYDDVVRDTGSYSRFFDLDAWFASKLPEAVQKTFPALVVAKPHKNEKNRYA
jgi:DNA modification methylase